MSAASTIVNKRKRVDEDADIGVNATVKTLISAPARSESLWIRDGNIVLQAEGTQFKVYQGLLAIQSAIFGDMFAVPPPSTGQDQVEGCPLVHLSDAAADLAFALEAIFLRKWVATGEPIPIEVVAAFLRLGNKYEIEALRAEALKRLSFEFPSEWAVFDEHIYPVNRRGTMIELAEWTFIDVANLAREQNLLSVLPLALYACCRKWNAPDLERGQRRADGTLATLSPVNEHACFRAYFELLRFKEENAYGWTLAPKSSYPSCRQQCSITRSKAQARYLFPMAVAGCLQKWEKVEEMCLFCTTTAHEMQDAGMEKTWRALPGAFGLPNWEELTKD